MEQIYDREKKDSKNEREQKKGFQHWVQKEIQKNTDDLSGIQFYYKGKREYIRFDKIIEDIGNLKCDSSLYSIVHFVLYWDSGRYVGSYR